MTRETDLFASGAVTPTQFTAHEVRRWNRARHAADEQQAADVAGDWETRLYELGRWLFGIAIACVALGIPFIFARIGWAFFSGQVSSVMDAITKGAH